ncbi:MAG TPA: AraC family transcriptional regulator [Puia sp.]|nr:AraC family transcriptional regulator [Puia sp.]
MPDAALDHSIVFAARHAIVDVHYHQCFQIVISLYAPFDSTIDGQDYPQLTGFLINQGVTHSCDSRTTEVLVYFIDADSYQGWQFREMLNGNAFVPIEQLLTPEELDSAAREYRRTKDTADLRAAALTVMDRILPPTGVSLFRPMDDRLTTALAYIDANLDNPLALEDLAAQVFLSTERLRHLFASETGIPFSQYVLWRRIKGVLSQVVEDGASMATAAIHYGFTDQAHFTRLFKRTFGVSAKQLLKNSRFIQFVSPAL